jgi:hypothetical protein
VEVACQIAADHDFHRKDGQLLAQNHIWSG